MPTRKKNTESVREEAVNTLTAHTLHPVPDSLSPLLASMVEPMACSYRGIALGRLRIESRVLVLGAGTVGLFAGLLARDRTAEVAITTRYPQQIKAARRLGLTPLGESEWEDWARDRYASQSRTSSRRSRPPKRARPPWSPSGPLREHQIYQCRAGP